MRRQSLQVGADFVGGVPGAGHAVGADDHQIHHAVLGKRSDIIGYRKVLLICLLGATLTSAPQIFVGSYWAFVAERFAVGLFIGGILPTANALIGRSVSRENRGTIFGMTASATFLGNSLGPLTGGSVAALLGIRWVFVVTTVLLAANLIWVWFTVSELKEQPVAE